MAHHLFAHNSRAIDGLQSYCRECSSEWARMHRARKQEVRPATEPGFKWCRRCRQIKELSAFGRHAKTTDRLQTYCKDCFADIYREKREREGDVVRPSAVPEGNKFCRSCSRVLPLSGWPERGRGSDGYHSRCRECETRTSRASHLSRKYGLSVEQVEEMLEAQGGQCAICRTAAAVHVDHDHDSGTVRGMLCFRCNAALGQLDDSPERLRRAADYLETDLDVLLESAPTEDEALRRLSAVLGRPITAA